MDKTSYVIRKYFNIYRYFAILSGTWPYQSKISARIAQTFFALQHISIWFPEIIKLFESTHDADLVIESVPPVFYNVLITVMFLNSVYHQQEIRTILERIHEDWERLSDKNERQILSNYTNLATMMTYMYMGACYLTGLMFCAFPVTPVIMDYIYPLNESRPKIPMYRTEFFVDEDKYFYSILAHNSIVTLVGMSAVVNVDIYLASISQHICGMLTILGQRLEKTHREGTVKKLDDTIYQEMLTCLKMHNNIIDLLHIMNKTTRTALGILLLVLVVLMSFTGLVVLLKWGMWTDCIRFGLFTGAELFHIYCYSYHSQNLIDHNVKVFRALQNSGWYQSSIRTQILVNMMFLRCKRPFLIFCMTFPLSMENFTLIIKTSFSYFTVVKSTL